MLPKTVKSGPRNRNTPNGQYPQRKLNHPLRRISHNPLTFVTFQISSHDYVSNDHLLIHSASHFTKRVTKGLAISAKLVISSLENNVKQFAFQPLGQGQISTDNRQEMRLVSSSFHDYDSIQSIRQALLLRRRWLRDSHTRWRHPSYHSPSFPWSPSERMWVHRLSFRAY